MTGELDSVLAAMLDALPGQIAMVDNTGTIRMANASWRRFAADRERNASTRGGDQNYLIVCDSGKGSGAKDASAVSAGIRAILDGKAPDFIYEYTCRTGSAPRWFRLTATRIEQPGGPFAVLMNVDITDQRQLEDHLRKLSMAVEQSPVSILITDTTATIEYVNPHLSVVSGFSPEEVIGRNPRIWKGPETPGHLYRDLWATISAGGTWEGDLQNTTKSGKVLWEHVKIAPLRNAEGAITNFVAVKEDITGRRQAEAELRASEGRLRALFETVHLVALGLDAQGRVEYVNPFFLQLTGYTHEEVLGADWFTRFVPVAARPEILGAFQGVIERGTPTHYRNAILTKAGKEVTISWHNTPLRNEEGRAIGTLSLGEDVTEHAQLEDQYRQAQKMEAIGRLAGGVAHDFNNLLTVITSYTEMLVTDLAAGDPRRDDLDQIRKAAEGATSLTRQLLAFSRQQVIEARDLALNDAVQAACKMLTRLIGEDIELAFLPGSGPITVRMDPGQLEQIIMNLAVNSRDAMPQGGKLTIETSSVELDHAHAAAHWPSVPGHFALLALSDTGLGMDEPTQARIFEPFFTTKEAGKGTGLGLATVYGIVKQSGGFIWVYSEPGQGTTFKIYLPILGTVAVEAAPGPPASQPKGGDETILLAEDSAAVRGATKQILERLGYTVIGAPSGRAALNILGKFQHAIHLLLTDVVMPEMSGRELAEKFRTLRPEGKVLFMSGYTNDAVVLHGVLESGLAFLQKPFSPDSLASKVRDVLDKP